MDLTGIFLREENNLGVQLPYTPRVMLGGHVIARLVNGPVDQAVQSFIGLSLISGITD